MLVQLRASATGKPLIDDELRLIAVTRTSSRDSTWAC
jgi:hypothetical protein